MLMLEKRLEREKQCIEFSKREIVFGISGGYQRIVVAVEAGLDVANELGICQGLAGESHMIHECLHLVVVLRCAEVMLASLGKHGTNLVDASLGFRGKHALECAPHGGDGGQVYNLSQDLRFKRQEQVPKDLLFLGRPDIIVGVDGLLLHRLAVDLDGALEGR